MNEVGEAVAPPARESSGCVLGISTGLAVVLLAIGALVAARGRAIDGESLVLELGGSAELPFGLEVQDAAQLPGGDRVVRLAASEEADWGVDGPAPYEVILADYRRAASVSQLFRPRGQDGGKRAKWEMDPSFTFEELLEADELEWGAFRAVYLRMRTYAEGGGWSDTVRVNLSREDRWCVLFATWRDGVEGSPEPIRELLSRMDL